MSVKLSDVKRRGRRWQQLLRLEDWDIQWEMAPGDHQTVGYLGLCARNSPLQEARILIAADADEEPGDLERIIVHELLHITLDHIWPTSRRDVERGEQAVHRISQLLAALYSMADG